MNDIKALASAWFIALMLSIIVLHVLGAVFRKHNMKKLGAASAVLNIITHTALIIYLLISRAELSELLLSLLLSLTVSLALNHMKGEDGHNGI